MAEKYNPREFLTTSQAAKYLSVSADTVLKWVRAGKIKSHRTLGGHFRIPLSALNVTEDSGASDRTLSARADNAFMYCWEYLASGDKIKSECRDCITYRSRSRRCYELRDLPGGFGCLAMQCAASCEECEYFKLVRDHVINVLILGEPERVVIDFDGTDRHPDLAVKYIADEYKAASIIQTFRPDYIVIDCSIGKRRTSALCTNLFNDARIPVARIILASKVRNLNDYCDKEIFGWIRKPFSIEQLFNLIRSVPQPEKVEKF